MSMSQGPLRNRRKTVVLCVRQHGQELIEKEFRKVCRGYDLLYVVYIVIYYILIRVTMRNSEKGLCKDLIYSPKVTTSGQGERMSKSQSREAN